MFLTLVQMVLGVFQIVNDGEQDNLYVATPSFHHKTQRAEARAHPAQGRIERFDALLICVLVREEQGPPPLHIDYDKAPWKVPGAIERESFEIVVTSAKGSRDNFVFDEAAREFGERTLHEKAFRKRDRVGAEEIVPQLLVDVKLDRLFVFLRAPCVGARSFYAVFWQKTERALFVDVVGADAALAMSRAAKETVRSAAELAKRLSTRRAADHASIEKHHWEILRSESIGVALVEARQLSADELRFVIRHICGFFRMRLEQPLVITKECV